MLRNLPVSVLALLLAAAGCARHAPVAVLPQTRIGPAQDFGLGIVDATPYWVKFDLDLPAYVIGFRMTDVGGIEQVWNTVKLGRGTYVVHARGSVSVVSSIPE
jgi:hypothetical protein